MKDAFEELVNKLHSVRSRNNVEKNVEKNVWRGSEMNTRRGKLGSLDSKIWAYMDRLTHANCITYVFLRKFETLELQTEQLYSTKYVIENLLADAFTFSDWNKKGLLRPLINRYIADDFT